MGRQLPIGSRKTNRRLTLSGIQPCPLQSAPLRPLGTTSRLVSPGRRHQIASDRPNAEVPQPVGRIDATADHGSRRDGVLAPVELVLSGESMLGEESLSDFLEIDRISRGCPRLRPIPWLALVTTARLPARSRSTVMLLLCDPTHQSPLWSNHSRTASATSCQPLSMVRE
jgi:hypothetical protein